MGGDTDTHDDPLLDCIELLAKFHGHPVSRTALRAGLPLVNNSLTVELFSRAADRAGLSSRVLRKSLSDLSDTALPAVLLLRSHRACVVMQIDEQQTLTVALPESGMGEKKISLEELEELYTGFAIFVRPKYQTDAKNFVKQIRHPRSWFWGTIFSSWRIYRDVVVASLLINIFGLTTPFFILNVYDRVINNTAFNTLWVLASGVVVIFVFEFLMRILRGYFIDEAGKKANLIISAALFEKVLGLRMEVRPKSVGAFTKNIQQFDAIRDFITSFSITAIIDLPFVGLGLLAIWYLAGQIVFIHIASILLLLGYAFLIQIPLRQAINNTFEAATQKNAILVEGLTGIETIKMLGAESQIQRAWEESVSYIAKWAVRSRLLSSSVQHVSNFIRNFTIVATVVAGVYLIANGEMSKGGLIACVILTRRVVAPMSKVMNLATRFYQAKATFSILNKVMEMPVERPPGKTFLHRTDFRGKIDIQDVTFSYPEQKNNVLKNVSLHISQGERIAIIGPVGSGKTTLGKLILGLYEPTEGMVAMDGTDIRQIDPSELRQFIGCVPQDVTLFRGTVRDNIILGTHGINDTEILRAAEMSGVAAFVAKHPMGFDMPVGEQGRGLSGGQRQAVAMARAILLNPPVILLDEPSSSMDNKTESRLKKQLEKILANKTMIMITHRGSLLDLVERIVVFDSGTIIADGPRERILKDLKSGELNV